MTDCFCDRCTGRLPCEAVGHDYGNNPHNANCIDCGETNGPLLSYIGRVAKLQKKTGLSWEDAQKLIALRAAAVELIGGKLSARLSWAGITEDDL